MQNFYVVFKKKKNYMYIVRNAYILNQKIHVQFNIDRDVYLLYTYDNFVCGLWTE